MSINKIEQGDPLTMSKDIVNDNIEKLKQLFPEILTEGKIDFKVLKQVLGEELEEEEEYYRFTWAGKNRARQEAHKPSTGTLRPCKEDSVDWDKTKNLYIEGDNLEVLKLLQKSYAKKVKMIYIDPPYNTGKDFVYKDNYKDNLGNYLELTGQTDEQGNKLSTNTESDGRFHSNWLNMMYPRLILARNLLKEDGVIFISIDDNEVENLKKICNEIFGEENFIANVIWQRAFSPKNDAKYLSENHDYVLIYSKNNNHFDAGRLERTKEANERYKNYDNDPRGVWISDNLTVKTYSEKYDYPITTPSGRIVNPADGRCWNTSFDNMQKLIADNRIWFGADGGNVPRLKRFLSDVQDGMVATTLWLHQEVGHNQEGRQEVKALFNDKGYFDGPKPIKLLKRVLRIANTEKDSIILDFFSGSGSTAHAVMKLNAEDGGNRRHIQVQLPEATDEKSEANKTGYKTIPEIGKERIRRAAKKIAEENPDKAKDMDLGFKVFKLDQSNINAWDGKSEDLKSTLQFAEESIKADRSQEDVLYEILLKYGLDLTLPIEEKTIAGAKVFNVGFGAIFICLEDKITKHIAQGIGEWKQQLEPETCRVIFKDSGFSVVEKTNSLHTLQTFGINEVRSI